ncbi:MAG: periplasmic heavy metal sensor [Rhizobiaceae bacterium]
MNNRARTIVLAISLAFNVFIIGAAVGGAYMWHESGSYRPAFAARSGLGGAAEKLPVAERRTFRRMLAQTRKDAASDIEAARAGRLRLAQLMTADPIDRQAIDAQLSATRQTDSALRAKLEKTVVDFFETLPPSERQTFVEGLRGHGAMLRRGKAGKH